MMADFGVKQDDLELKISCKYFSFHGYPIMHMKEYLFVRSNEIEIVITDVPIIYINILDALN